MTMTMVPLVVAAMLTLSPVSTSLPSAAVPSGFVAHEGSAGGRVIYGPVRAANTDGALKAGLRAADAYFGGSLTIDSIVRNTSGAAPAMTAWFHATLHGTPVAGLASAAVDPHAGPRIALLFDRPDRIARSLPALSADLSPRGDASGAPAGPLHRVTAHDNSLSIAIPSNWTVASMEHGSFSVAGPDGARVDSLGVTVAPPTDRYLIGAPHVAFIADPAAAFVAVRRAMARPGDPDPNVHIDSSRPLKVPSYVSQQTRASIVNGTLTLASGRRRFTSFIATLPPSQPNGPWVLTLAEFISAPVDRFARDIPTLVAIGNSVAFNGAVIARQNAEISKEIADAAQRNVDSATTFRQQQDVKFRQSMASAHAAQDSIDRSTAGFVQYLGDRSVVNDASTGGHSTMGNAAANSMVKAHPNQYSIVPLNQYRKGVDY